MDKTKTPLDGIIKWMTRPEWREAFAEVFVGHVGAACEDAEVEVDELAELIGEPAAMNLWACAFEDFLTSTTDDGRNLVDDYLKRRGWKEANSIKEHLAALRHSVMSLYEVVEVVPGESFVLRDLVRGGEPIGVAERMATHGLAPGERLAARVLRIRARTILGHGMLQFQDDTAESLLMTLARMAKAAREEGEGEATEADMLARAASLFSDLWLADGLDEALAPDEPLLTNDDGELLALVDVTYGLLPGVGVEAVRAALAELPHLHATGEGVWHWLPDDIRPAAPEADEPGFDEVDDVLGLVEVDEVGVSLRTNSSSRGERGMAMLGPALRGLVAEPQVQTVTLDDLDGVEEDDLDADEDLDDEVEGDGLPLVTLSPQQTTEIAAAIDASYRHMLGRPQTELDDLTPLQAAESAQGRDRLVPWLTGLERELASREPDSLMAGHDLGWMWEMLGISDRRPGKRA